MRSVLGFIVTAMAVVVALVTGVFSGELGGVFIRLVWAEVVAGLMSMMVVQIHVVVLLAGLVAIVVICLLDVVVAGLSPLLVLGLLAIAVAEVPVPRVLGGVPTGGVVSL